MPRKVYESDDEEEEMLPEEQKADAESKSAPVKKGLDDKDLLVHSDEESGSDSEPEDVAFSASKQTILERVRSAVDQISKDKQQQKLKRKQKDDKFKEQKKQKLNQVRLSDDVLNALQSGPIAKKKERVAKSKTGDAPDEDDDIQHMDDEIADLIGDEELGLLDDTGDFIPLDSNAGIAAVALSDLKKQKPKSSAERAAEFRQQRLFGNKVHRVPVREKLAKKTKRKARFL